MENFIKLICLILEPIAIVADDLKTMVEEEMPGTKVVLANSVEAALTLLSGTKVDVAFLNLSPAVLERTNLQSILNNMSATVVLMGHESHAKPVNFRSLELPFVGNAVAHELRLALLRLLGLGSDTGSGSAT